MSVTSKPRPEVDPGVLARAKEIADAEARQRGNTPSEAASPSRNYLKTRQGQPIDTLSKAEEEIRSLRSQLTSLRQSQQSQDQDNPDPVRRQVVFGPLSDQKTRTEIRASDMMLMERSERGVSKSYSLLWEEPRTISLFHLVAPLARLVDQAARGVDILYRQPEMTRNEKGKLVPRIDETTNKPMFKPSPLDKVKSVYQTLLASPDVVCHLHDLLGECAAAGFKPAQQTIRSLKGVPPGISGELKPEAWVAGAETLKKEFLESLASSPIDSTIEPVSRALGEPSTTSR